MDSIFGRTFREYDERLNGTPIPITAGKRRNKTNKSTKKGGLFGVRSYKTKSDNKTNCRRLAENYKKKRTFI